MSYESTPDPAEQSETPSYPLALTLHVTAPAPDGTYPLHAYLSREERGEAGATIAEAQSVLVLPPRLVDMATRLLQPRAHFKGGDETELGAVLARLLLQPPVRSLLLRGVAQARAEQTLLHLQLLFDPPELTLLPWEWLSVAGKQRWVPALLEDYGLSRLASPRTEEQRPQTPLRRMTAGLQHLSAGLFKRSPARMPPVDDDNRSNLRVLLVASDARDATLRAVGTTLEELAESYDLSLKLLVAPTPSELRRALRQVQPHILHLLTHVTFDAPDHPLLLLEPPYAAADLLPLVGQIPPLGIVLDGGWQEAESLSAAAVRLAHALAGAGCGTVTFGSPLYPAESALFARALYTALAQGEPLYEAVTMGRRALVAGGAGGAWGLPLLVGKA